QKRNAGMDSNRGGRHRLRAWCVAFFFGKAWHAGFWRTLGPHGVCEIVYVVLAGAKCHSLRHRKSIRRTRLSVSPVSGIEPYSRLPQTTTCCLRLTWNFRSFSVCLRLSLNWFFILEKIFRRLKFSEQMIVG